MDLRPSNRSDVDRLLELTIETFGPFYEESFRPIVGDTVFVHQHGSWREDYREQVSHLDDPAQHKHVVVAEDAGEIVGYVAWHTETSRCHGSIDIVAVARPAGHSPSSRGRTRRAAVGQFRWQR